MLFQTLDGSLVESVHQSVLWALTHLSASRMVRGISKGEKDIWRGSGYYRFLEVYPETTFPNLSRLSISSGSALSCLSC